jgi:Fe-S-cluster containining protein
VAIEIDRPTTKREYENVIWYLLHEGVSVFVEDDRRWFVEFSTPCTALNPQGLCTRYGERPQICRDYAVEDCVRHAPLYQPLHEFHTADEFISFLDSSGIQWRYKRRPGAETVSS